MRSSDWSSDVCSSDLGRPAACKPNRPLPNRRSKEPHLEHYHGTTILGVKKGGKTVVAGDGQVSLGNTVIKPNARKVRRLGGDGNVIGGFAGATADAFTLFERLENKLEQNNGQLLRAAVGIAKIGRAQGRTPVTNAHLG